MSSIFDTMPDELCNNYQDHYWEGDFLYYKTQDDFTLIILVEPSDTHQSLFEKIELAHDKAVEDLEREEREWIEIDRYERPWMYPKTGHAFELVFV